MTTDVLLSYLAMEVERLCPESAGTLVVGASTLGHDHRGAGAGCSTPRVRVEGAAAQA